MTKIRPANRGRMTQAERSRQTSSKLKKATINLIHDRGLQNVTTPEIARKAGVSRGALTHHFKGREHIITQSIEDMLNEATDRFRAFAQRFAEEGGTSDDIVDFLWAVMSDRLFYVTLEFLPAARHSARFQKSLVPVVRGFHEGLDAIWTALADATNTPPEQTRVAMNSTMCLIRGMIAQTILRDDPEYFETMLNFWKTELRRQFQDTQDAGGSRA